MHLVKIQLTALLVFTNWICITYANQIQDIETQTANNTDCVLNNKGPIDLNINLSDFIQNNRSVLLDSRMQQTKISSIFNLVECKDWSGEKKGTATLTLDRDFSAIPIEFLIRTNKKKWSLKVKILPHPFRWGKRKGFIKTCKMHFDNKKNDIQCLLEITSKTHTHTVYMNGSIDIPNTEFQSKPKISFANRISYIFFNRKVSDLSAHQENLFKNLYPAFKIKSLSIKNIWLLWVYSIEEIDINTKTHQISAILRTPKKKRIRIGKKLKGSESIFRRRIGESWFLTTVPKTRSATEPPVGTIYLEWYRRF